MDKPEPELRKKYLDALERLDASEARVGKLESVLRLTVGRLCLAARGRSAALDVELKVLSELLRREPDPYQIEGCLEPLSRAVAALDQSTPPAPAPAGLKSAAGDRDTQVDTAIVSMLDRLALLPELKAALGELHERGSGLTSDELAEGLDRVARLIGEQRTRLQREKLEIEELLRQIDARLEEVASYITGEAAEHKSTQDSTQQLNLLVLDEVHELHTDVQRAVDLGELRGRVRVRLEAIHTHLEDFRAREEQRFASQNDRTGRLRVRIAELEHESRNLQRSLAEEQRLATIDSLTGIANRAAYDERIEQEYLRWQRSGAAISILAWDIDRFKAVNDAYGHRAGDKVLRVVAQHLARHVRGTDFVARYGGEEFVMILVGTPSDQALLAADKIRAGIERIGFHFRGKPVTVTASCGIATFQADDTPDSIFDRADRALYGAKDAGRNCCITL
ncbi:MAG: diguanylate cyclase [Steroidobacteraceae bacterium]